MRNNLSKLLKKSWEILLDCIYPRRCAICDRTITGHNGICRWCEPGVRFVEEPVCMKCGKHVKNQTEIFCYDCKRTVKAFNRGFAVFEYEYIKESLFKFKYSGRAEYSSFYADMTAKRLGETFAQLGIEAFVPVPIHRKRYAKRGYNQAEEYAKELSRLTGIGVKSKWIARAVNTAPLKKMGNQDRQKNLEKAFKLNRNDVKLEKVCIVDDIYTTGATINRIARLLREQGVKEVYFVTIAIGKGL